MFEPNGGEGDQANSQGSSQRSSPHADSREEDALAAMMSLASGLGSNSGVGGANVWKPNPTPSHEPQPLWEQPGRTVAYFPHLFQEAGIREYPPFGQLQLDQRQDQYYQQPYPPMNSFLRDLAVREQQRRHVTPYLGQHGIGGIGNAAPTGQPFADGHALARMMMQMNAAAAVAPPPPPRQGDSSGHGFSQQEQR
jgi:hypothetical protein